MSIKDVVNGIGERVGHLVSPGPTDHVALREPVLRAIARADRQWADAAAGDRGDWFSEENGNVAFTPTLANGAPLTIDGQTTVFVPAVRFADYLGNMRAAVEAGVFDAEIAAGVSGSPNVSGLAQVPMPERRQGSDEAIRREQRAEAMRRDGRNPDGSIVHAVGERPDAQALGEPR